MRILYVEDNETNQALVDRVMRAKQHTVLFRDEGEGALALLEQDGDIDLILLDIELAGTFSGLDVIRTLRARGDKRPVVAVTAYAMMGDRERFLEAGCNQYLPKPLNIADLMAVLDEYEAGLSAGTDAAPTPAPQTAPSPEPSPPETPAAPAETPAPSVTACAAPPEKVPASDGRTPVHEERPT